jgi:hypothetical protein
MHMHTATALIIVALLQAMRQSAPTLAWSLKKRAVFDRPISC